MNLSESGAQFIGALEGCVLQPYNDSQGHATIGFGHLLHYGNVTEADRVQYANFNRADAEALFRQDIDLHYVPTVNSGLKVAATQNQFDALVSFCYNVGAQGFLNSTPLRLLNAGDVKGAAAGFDLWHIPAEIIGRRNKEKALFLSDPSPTSSLVLAGSDGLHPIFIRRLLSLQQVVPFTITSGARTTQEQTRLYDLFLHHHGAPANRPGTSWHEMLPPTGFAQAADLAGDYSALHGAANACGIHFPVSNEPWHCQPYPECMSPHYVATEGLTEEDDDMKRVVHTTKLDGTSWPGQYLTDNMLVSYIFSGEWLAELESLYGPTQPMARAKFDQLIKLGSVGWPNDV